MTEFFTALTDPDVPFLRYSLIAGLLASLAFGIIGTYVVSRRISSLAGAIAHCVLGGVGAGVYCQHVLGWEWCSPRLGAVVVGLIAAIIIGVVDLKANERVDSVITSLWVIGMSAGIIFINKTPAFVDLDSYLFGNMMLIDSGDLNVILLIDIFVIALGILFYNKLLAICFDEEFAYLRGIKTGFYYILLLCLTVMTVVMMMQIVGIILVLALLTLPAAAARAFSSHLWQMMLIATILCMLYVFSGMALSFGPDLPPGPIISIIAGSVYVGIHVARFLQRFFKKK